MEAVREIFDRRIVNSLSEKDEADLAQTVWKGRPGQAERAAQSIRNWKSLVVPSLLVRADRYAQRTANMQQTWEDARAARAAEAASKTNSKRNRRRGGKRAAGVGENERANCGGGSADGDVRLGGGLHPSARFFHGGELSSRIE